MDALTLLKTQVRGLRRDWNSVMGDMTQEQLLWRPPGIANPIVSLVMHVVGGQDNVVNVTAQGKQKVWDANNWGEKLKVSPVGRQDLEAGRNLHVDIDGFKEYADEVFASVDAYLAQAQLDDLDREVQGFGGNMVPLGNMLSGMLVTHFMGHLGEVSALKGCQGGKGWAG